jgi:hypothetical protein
MALFSQMPHVLIGQGKVITLILPLHIANGPMVATLLRMQLKKEIAEKMVRYIPMLLAQNGLEVKAQM